MTPEERTCPRCGATFTTVFETKVYCNSRCAEHARRMRRTAEAAAYRASVTAARPRLRLPWRRAAR